MDFERRKNINRGYRKLVVWQDAVAFYAMTYEVFQRFPFLLQRVASQQIASVDSIHRNIAEGYCRRSLKEYLQFLNIALSSAGESVSGLHAYRMANHISETDFERLDTAAWKLENGLKRLIESLQEKRAAGEWDDSFLKDESVEYGVEGGGMEDGKQGSSHPSTLPFFHPSTPPSLQLSIPNLPDEPRDA